MRTYLIAGLSLLVLAGCQPSLESRLEEARDLVFERRAEEAIVAYRSLLYHLEGKEGPGVEQARVEALSRIGDLSYLELRAFPAAAEAYRSLLAAAPASEEAHWAREKLAEIAHRHLDDIPQAIGHWQALASSGREGTDRFAYLVAKAYFELRNFEQSRSEAEAVSRNFPDSKWAQDALFLLATTWQFEGKHAEAIEAFERVERTWEGSEIAARAQLERGRARFAVGDADGALADYLEALKRHPDPERVQAEIARARRHVAELERMRKGGRRAAFQG